MRCYRPAMSRWSSLALLLLLSLSACDSADAGKQAASELGDKAGALADDAIVAGKEASKNAGDAAVQAGKDAAKQAGDAALEAGKDAAKQAGDAAAQAGKALAETTVDDAQRWLTDLPDDGVLSDEAKAWLRTKADDTSAGIARIVADGDQLAPEALDIGKGMASAVSSDSSFEPIVQRVEDSAKVDAAIGDMPKVEVVDGLTVGVQRVDGWEGATHQERRGYLVTWREGDYLYGFVYRSRRDVDLAVVAGEVPRLVRLVRAAVAAD